MNKLSGGPLLETEIGLDSQSNPGNLVEYDPEIEPNARRTHGKTLREKKKKQREQADSEGTASTTNEESIDSTHHPADPTHIIEVMHAPMADQTIRELAAAPTVQQPLGITFPQGETLFQLKTGLIHLLPTFHGLPSESPHKHLTEFHLVCSSMIPQGVSEDQIKLRAFPFSLSGIAKEWLFYLPPNSITTWNDLNKKFLSRFFPVGKASEIRRSILGIKQNDQTLVQYIYEGLLPMEMKMVDAAIGGALLDMMPTQEKELISTMAANSQQFGALSEPNRRVHGVNIVSIENKIDQITNIVNSLVAGKNNSTRACGICTMTDHPTDLCPNLQDETLNAVGTFPGPPQRPYNPHSNTYNPGWRDHLNLSYAPNWRPNLPYQPRPSQSYQQPQKSPLELMMEKFIASQEKIQNQNQIHFQELDKQVSQLAQIVGRLESRGKLPSQTETNPKENVSAITLRSGTTIEPPIQNQKEKPTNSEEDGAVSKGVPTVEPKQSPYAEPPPFPSRFLKKNKQAEDKDILDIFRKVELNILLLEVIRKITRYARFLKDLCTNKRKLMGHEKINLGENVSAVLTCRLPPKLKDQGMFTIPCKIGNVGIKRAMCDLGASINVMPLSVYNTLSADPLKETRITVQLVDRSIVYPEGVLENVLVQVNELIFPADFYVIDMKSDHTNNSPEILLGHPFLSTTNVEIEVRSGLLTLECNGEVVKFNVYKTMRYLEEIESINFVDMFDPVIHDFIETNFVDKSCKEYDDSDNELREFEPSYLVNSVLSKELSTSPKTKLLPSVLQAPQIELKELSKHLKYAFLRDNDTLLVIVSNKLSEKEESQLISVLRKHKEAIGWTVAYTKGLSPSTCIHRIKVIEDAKPSREGQHRLNPPMMEVVKKEIQKLLDADIIYLISDSDWVSLIHVVPKKTGVTIVENPQGELIPTRVQNGWRVCIDYRKLNSLTRKDHFPLPFIDQLIERLAGKTHYCCLDGFLGFFRYRWLSKIKRKRRSRVPLEPLPIEACHLDCAIRRLCFSVACVGAVLDQKIGKEPHVIAYASRTLDSAQRNYSTTEKEHLAIVFALEKFCSYLLGTNVVVFSDHASLRYLMSKKEAKP
ncbi:hypothetical protein V6N11_051601 [Hibiscus sabdariffa]|uniref:Reverse transcriptase RNase H-like domain-containing protein n=1 Tax=Hibiscus sabdariffa TaxID=183260 RepID=A0ABR2U7U4_9ROSI